MFDIRHRFCLWHILSKLPEKFEGVIDHHNVTNEFKDLVFDNLETSTFENNWQQFIGKYGL